MVPIREELARSPAPGPAAIATLILLCTLLVAGFPTAATGRTASLSTPEFHASGSAAPSVPSGLTNQVGATFRIATLNESERGSGPVSSPSISNVFMIATNGLAYTGWDLGDGVWHTSAGMTNFTAGSDPDYPQATTLLTDGVNDFITLWDYFPDGSGGAGGAPESTWFHRNPDLVGYNVTFIRLVIHDLTFVPEAGYTAVFENYTWEFWGYREFGSFLPPTDANGTIAIDRRSTLVNVSLFSPGTAVLEWNGTNMSMTGAGTSWELGLTGLANGRYAYRVWATNGTGAVFVTDPRVFTVEVGVWSLTRVGNGYEPGVAMDAAGQPHVCFYGTGGALAGLVYGTRDNGTWNLSLVDGTGIDPGQGCMIAMDSLGRPHIAYVEGPNYYGNFTVREASLDGTAWNVTILFTGYYTEPAIAINPVTDLPMVAYGQVPADVLRLATQTATGWSTQVVDPAFNGNVVSLAVNATGAPTLAYGNGTYGNLTVARWTGAGWAKAIVDSGVGFISLKLDSHGLPHVAYWTNQGVKYAWSTGTLWTDETVDRKSFAGVALALDAQDHPHIAYDEQWGGDVRYATLNGTWYYEVVAHGSGGSQLALDLQPSGAAGIVFQTNATSGTVAYVTNQTDTAAPVTVAQLHGSAGNGGWYRSSVQVTLVATDDLAVLNTSYRLDMGAWLPYTGPFSVTGDGNHTVQYFSTDFAGLEEPIRTIRFGIDTVAPVVSTQVAGALGQAGWYRSAVNVTLTATDAMSGVASLQYRLDGGTWVGYTAPFPVSGDGTHFVQATATDTAGNTAPTQTLNLAIDTAAPASHASVSGTQGNAGWYVTHPTVQLTATDAMSGVAAIQYSLDGGGWQTYAAPFAVADGAHALAYRAVDRAGNVETAHTLTLNVDTTPPTISSLTPSGNVTTNTVTFSWSGSDTGSGISHFDIRVDGGTYQDLGTNTSDTLSLAQGSHTITVLALDVAGNVGQKTTTVVVAAGPSPLLGPFEVGLIGASLAIILVAVAVVYVWTRRRKAQPPPPPS